MKTGVILLASILIASSVARATTDSVIRSTHLNLFVAGLQRNIPSFGPQEAANKTADLVDFVLTVIAFGVVWGLNTLLLEKQPPNGLLALAYLVFAGLAFFQTHFVTFSGKSALALITLVQLGLILLARLKLDLQPLLKVDGHSSVLLMNGVLVGFYLMLIGNHYTTSVAIPLMLLAGAPLLYLAGQREKQHILTSPAHLFLIGAVGLANHLVGLFILGLVTGILVVTLRDRYQPVWLRKVCYPAGLIILFTFNPLFYVGNFDTVEEGFWLGWLQRLIGGQVLYRDVNVYHPPLIVWGGYLFQKLAGFSIASFRLYLHGLQILGTIIYYFAISRILGFKSSRLVVMLIALGVTSTMVRNNVEIRIATGLLPLICWSIYEKSRQSKWLITAGAAAAIALFTSLETGLAATLALAVGLVLSRKIIPAVVGWMATGGILVLILAAQGALGGFVNQLAFYAKAFADGYFNTPIDRSISLSFLHWHIINQYFSSTAWLWELARLGMLAGLGLAVSSVIKGKASDRDRLVVVWGLFALMIFRSALGRSDYFHLLFPLLLSVPLIFYVTEMVGKGKRLWSLIVALLFVFVFARDAIHASFLERVVLNWQTYGQPVGTYNQLSSRRSGILYGQETDTKSIDALLAYIAANTSSGDEIYSFPWAPEIYFLTNRHNATRIDTPYAFFSDEYQNGTIRDLQNSPPKLVIYNPQMRFAGMVPDSLPKIDEYIKQNFVVVTEYWPNQIMTAKAVDSISQ